MEGVNINKKVWVEGIKKALPRDIPLILLYFFLVLILGSVFLFIEDNLLKAIVIIWVTITAYLAFKRRMDHENMRIEKGVKNGT